MRKQSFQHSNLLHRYFKKFYNLQKRIRTLMQSGEFFRLSHGIQHQMVHRLKLLYERLERLAGKQKLRWAGTALAIVLSASVTEAQFNDPVSLTGFTAPTLSAPTFGDLDGDGDLDIVIGGKDGTLQYVVNNEGEYSYADENPFEGFNVGSNSSPYLIDLNDDGYLDLVVGEGDGIFNYFQNDEGVFTEMTGTDNPFNLLEAGGLSAPAFGDYDGDNEPDMVSGNGDGTIITFRNDDGSYTAVSSPFDAIDLDNKSVPCFTDYDNDNDDDLVIGNYFGEFHLYRNSGGVYTELTGTNNPFADCVGYPQSVPRITDVDEDGDLDLVVGKQDPGYLQYFRNDGGVYTTKRGQSNPFEGLLGDITAAPAFSDIDEDGDLDMILGEGDGRFKYFENTDEGLVVLTNPFNMFITGNYAKPAFGDVDGDGDEDMVAGDADGILHYYSKEAAGDFDEFTDGNNPFNGIDVEEYSAPALVDFDDDGDLDLFVGGKFYNAVDVEWVGTLSYFRNVSGSFIEQTGTDNPFEALLAGRYASEINPVFHDIDRDGDEDLFIGVKSTGTIDYFWNDDGVYSLADGRNPFLDVVFGERVSPAFADADGDGDDDLYVGIMDDEDGGVILFAESTQGPPEAVPVITEAAIRIYSQDKTIFLDAGNELLNRVEVYNLAGTLITSKTINAAGLYELNLPDVQSGMYIVRAYSDGKSSIKKFVIR